LLYDRIIRKGLSGPAFSHMPRIRSCSPEIEGGWTIDVLISEIGKYEYLRDFRNGSPNAYAAIVRKGVMHLMSGLKRGQNPRTDEVIRKDASLCGSRKEFKTRFPNSFAASLRRGEEYHNEICSKMKRPKSQESLAEIELLGWIKDSWPSAHKTRIYYINKKGRRTYYEYDIFIPELKVAIEYQGLYWHSGKMAAIDPDRIFKKVELAKENGIRLIVIFDDEWEKSSLMVKDKLKRTLENRDGEAILNYIKLLKKVEAASKQTYLFESDNAWQNDFVYKNMGMEFVKDIPPKEFFVKNKKRVVKNDTNKELPKIRDMGGKLWKIVL
jgi:hypothetical protein